MDDSEKCLYCGKNRDNLHHKNWARHVESCNKKRKRNSTCDVKKFFLTSAISSKPTQMSSTLTQDQSISENLDNNFTNSLFNDNPASIGQESDLTNVDADLNTDLVLAGQESELTNVDMDINTDLVLSGKESELTNVDMVLNTDLVPADNDPVNLIKSAPFSHEKRKCILSMGPHQPLKEDMPGRKFPVRNGRSFQVSWFTKKSPDGSSSIREWMSYSKIKDKIVCLYCILVGKNSNPCWVIEGFGTWNKASERILSHEISIDHIDACIKIKIEEQSIPLLPSLIKAKNEQVAANRLVVESIIDCLLYLAQHSLALRGHKENWTNYIKGNFKDLLCLMGKYYPPLGAYIEQHKKNKNKFDFISWRRQNQLLDCIASYIRNFILSQVRSVA